MEDGEIVYEADAATARGEREEVEDRLKV